MGVTRAAPSGSDSIIPRIYGPRSLDKDEFYRYKKEEEIMPVLAKIETIYSRVNVDKELVMDNGFCFGLMDPTTNILVNTAMSKAKAPGTTAAPPPPLADGGRRRRGRRRVAPDMNQRSLDGLTAFLTCLFPYLPDAEAWKYLDAAELDPLAAALLVISRRGMRRFDLCSGITVVAVEAALRCAAVAAKHPDPQRVVLGWKLLSNSHGLENFVSEISSAAGNKPDTVARQILSTVNFNGASSDINLQLKQPWQLAERRLDCNPIGRELPPTRGAEKRMLLATIHGLYLQALAMLPTAELSGRYHRSMLMGGHCYGPLDPVSNIIVNTVWYDQNFPSSKQVTLQMISTSCLWRVAARSLYGLVSFLCTRYPDLSLDLALRRLQEANANLQVADPNLFNTILPDRDTDSKLLRSESGSMRIGQGNPDTTCEIQGEASEGSTPSTTVSEAYAAAATAAFHCDPLAQKEFLGSPDVVSKLRVTSDALHLHDGHPLSSQDLEFLSMSLPSTSKSCQQQDLAPVKVKKSLYYYRSKCSGMFWGQHERVTSMVKAALDKFNETQEDRTFRLHIICGANELVSGPVPSFGEKIGDYNPWTPDKYYHTHINFLAVCEGHPHDSPRLFFAECGKDGAETCWCIPVTPQKPDAEQVRCIYCEYQGNRIVHPTMESFHGRDEFDKLFYLSDIKVYNNNKVIENKMVFVDKVHALEDDAIYQNCCVDDDDEKPS